MFSPATLVRSLVAALLLALAEAYSGQATAYGSAGQRGSGACEIHGDLGQYETYYAAMNHAQYSRGNCGKCIRVSGAAGSIVAMIVDLCPGCSHGDVDLSSEGLKKTTGYSWDRKPVSWDFVSCSGGGGGSSRSSRRSKKCSNGKKGKKCRHHRGLLAEAEE